MSDAATSALPAQQAQPLSDAELERMKAQLGAATPGPWEIQPNPVGGRHIPIVRRVRGVFDVICAVMPNKANSEANAAFIAAAPADMAALIGEVERYRRIVLQITAKSGLRMDIDEVVRLFDD